VWVLFFAFPQPPFGAASHEPCPYDIDFERELRSFENGQTTVDVTHAAAHDLVGDRVISDDAERGDLHEELALADAVDADVLLHVPEAAADGAAHLRGLVVAERRLVQFFVDTSQSDSYQDSDPGAARSGDLPIRAVLVPIAEPAVPTPPCAATFPPMMTLSPFAEPLMLIAPIELFLALSACAARPPSSSAAAAHHSKVWQTS